MANRIWEGRCEDCYDKKQLRNCPSDLVPEGMSTELCDECIQLRTDLRGQGVDLVPIGLLVPGTWRDAGSLTVVFQDGNRINVAVKHLADGDHVGLVRLQFPNQPKWLTGGAFGETSRRAISEAKSFLRQFYFPGMPIAFE